MHREMFRGAPGMVTVVPAPRGHSVDRACEQPRTADGIR
jgi:hypothetical protein